MWEKALICLLCGVIYCHKTSVDRRKETWVSSTSLMLTLYLITKLYRKLTFGMHKQLFRVKTWDIQHPKWEVTLIFCHISQCLHSLDAHTNVSFHISRRAEKSYFFLLEAFPHFVLFFEVSVYAYLVTVTRNFHLHIKIIQEKNFFLANTFYV